MRNGIGTKDNKHSDFIILGRVCEVISRSVERLGLCIISFKYHAPPRKLLHQAT